MNYLEACATLGLFSSQGKWKSKIKESYHKLSLLHHPDKNTDAESTAKFQRINEAHMKLIENSIDDTSTNTRIPFSQSEWSRRIAPLLSKWNIQEILIIGLILHSF